MKRKITPMIRQMHPTTMYAIPLIGNKCLYCNIFYFVYTLHNWISSTVQVPQVKRRGSPKRNTFSKTFKMFKPKFHITWHREKKPGSLTAATEHLTVAREYLKATRRSLAAAICWKLFHLCYMDFKHKIILICLFWLV